MYCPGRNQEALQRTGDIILSPLNQTAGWRHDRRRVQSYMEHHDAPIYMYRGDSACGAERKLSVYNVIHPTQ